MNRNRLMLCVAFIILLGSVSCLSYFWSSHHADSQKGRGNFPTPITYEQVLELCEKKESFILYIHRSSCKVCAIVTDRLYDLTGHGLPVYSFNMEYLLKTDEYDQVKEDLGFMYVPCFKYFESGKELAHLNNPLADSYFDVESGPDREILADEMVGKVVAFIEAAAAGTNLITEEPMMPAVTVKRVPAPEDDDN